MTVGEPKPNALQSPESHPECHHQVTQQFQIDLPELPIRSLKNLWKEKSFTIAKANQGPKTNGA